MNLEDRNRLEELRAKFNNGETVSVEEKQEFDRLTEEYNRTGGNPVAATTQELEERENKDK